jgi:polar amino acid transport system substrate-binding protein
MRGTRFWTLLALCVALALGVAACGSDDDDSTSGDGGTSADVETLEEGVLLVGTDTPYPPFEIGQADSPDFTGYDIEILNAMAEEMGLEVEYQDTSFDTIFRDVAAGKFDTEAAASSITDGRERTVDFTNPYYQTKGALVVAEGETEIASTDDLADTIVGAQDATTLETYANDNFDASEVRGFPEGPDAINAVRTGQVDAAFIDAPVAQDALDKQGGIEIAEEVGIDEFFGYAVAQGNTSLLDAMNEALQTVKDDGTLAELYEKYFKVEPPESVLTETHEPT